MTGYEQKLDPSAPPTLSQSRHPELLVPAEKHPVRIVIFIMRLLENESNRSLKKET